MASGLRYVQFYPTVRCNLSCSGCFNRGIRSTRDVTVREYATLVAMLDGAGIREIDILGGEPTLVPYLDRIVSLNAGRNITTSLSSNGAHPEILEDLVTGFGSDLLSLGVSLYPDILSQRLLHFVRTHRPVVKSLVSGKDAVPAECLQYLNIIGIRYYLLYFDTVAAGDLERSMPFWRYHRIVQAMRKQYAHIGGVHCSGFLPDSEVFPELNHVRCPAGTTKLSIMPDGSVYPCYLLFRSDRFLLGNVFEHDLGQIMHSPVLDFFRHFNGNPCRKKECALHSECHGGCPAVSYLLLGNIAAPDPRCNTEYAY